MADYFGCGWGSKMKFELFVRPSKQCQVGENEITTLMIVDIPPRYSIQDLVAVFDDQGFANTYDFVYIPEVKKKRVSRATRFAFVNFVRPESVTWRNPRVCVYVFRALRSWFAPLYPIILPYTMVLSWYEVTNICFVSVAFH